MQSSTANWHVKTDPFEATRPRELIKPRRCWVPTSFSKLRVYLKRVDEDEKLKTELKAWETHLFWAFLVVFLSKRLPFSIGEKPWKNGGSLVVSWIHRKKNATRLGCLGPTLQDCLYCLLKFEPITFLGKVAMFANSKAQFCWNHCYFHVTRACEKMPSCQFTSTL